MTGGSLADREPCPWRIVDDVGGAYSMGAIGGGLFHSIKGAWNAPRGGKMMGSMLGLQARGPILGGQFAVWGGLFACCDCSLTAIRQKVGLFDMRNGFICVSRLISGFAQST